jgi:magnesium-transporting ATPase (P-type)
MSQEPLPPFHALPGEAAIAALESGAEGLDEAEAALRLTRYGPNALPEPPRVHPLLQFLAQFNNALIYFLLASAVAALFLDHTIDALVILLVVLINAIIGFIQEGRAENTLNGIRKLVSAQAVVMRPAGRAAVDVAALVPGDIVLLEPGDRVPADLRLLRARGLAVEEATLTGESVAAEKQEEPVAVRAPLADRVSMAFSGTLVARGQATGLVVATGSATEIGRISGLLQSVPPLVTPLLRQLNSFGRKLTFLILGASAALFAFAVIVRGYDWVDMLIAVVAVAVGAIPEGLPAVISITLAIGVQRMAQRKAVIRKLPAVETLGATSVICTDKTGTLTRNEMTVVRIYMRDAELAVTGIGYAPHGSIDDCSGRDDAEALAAAVPLIRCGMLCNDAEPRNNDGTWTVAGDPMEGALLVAGAKAGLDANHQRSEWPRLDEVPFDAVHRFMATLNRAPDGRRIVSIKGAPEEVLALCGEVYDPKRLVDTVEEAAMRGERLLGFATFELPADRDRIALEDVRGAHMLGLISFIDPPREEVRIAIAECRSAGIAVKMITGDHVATAVAIARQLNLADDPQALTGAEIEAMDDAALRERVRNVAVFARTSPEHKLRIVRALQSHGEIIAMTGDGVNDAPSLKQADVGTAMGTSGTEAAREASEMVLLDDNFASIVAAVREGRTVYDNIRKVIAWTLPTNGGEVIVVVLAILLGFTLPMTATQILWVNLVTASTLGMALAFEPAEPGIMARPPRMRDAPLLSPFLLWRVISVSALFGGSLLAVFFGSRALGDPLPEARTLVVNMLVVGQIFYLFSVRFMHMRSITLAGAKGTRPVLIALAAVVVAQLAFIYFPPFQAVFESQALSWRDMGLLAATGLAIFLILEAEKATFRRLGWFEELRA